MKELQFKIYAEKVDIDNLSQVCDAFRMRTTWSTMTCYNSTDENGNECYEMTLYKSDEYCFDDAQLYTHVARAFNSLQGLLLRDFRLDEKLSLDNKFLVGLQK